MRKIERAIHFDFHTNPGIDNFNEIWDAKAFAETLEAANVKYVNAFARCNEGFSYYPTKIGTVYPGMKGDMFGDLLRECHKRNIGVTAYINVGYDHELARTHKDWCVVNKARTLENEKYGIANYFIDMCYYHSGYRDFLISMIQEIVNNYDVDGLFLDCMSRVGCHCAKCAEYMVDHGRNPLSEEDAYLTSSEAQIDFCKQVQSIVGKDKYLFFNGLEYYRGKNLNTHIEIEGLPGGQGYDYFPVNVAYARNISDNVIYMTARFQWSWGDFGGFKTKASLENDIWDALSSAVEVSVGDHQHPAETLETSLYATIGEIYNEIKGYEPWIKNDRYIPEIAIVTNTPGTQGDSSKGAVQMLGELKYNYDIVNEEMDFSKYQLIILPDNILITPTLEEKLKIHLGAGKGIISSGFSGLNEDKTAFAMKQWTFDFDGVDSSNASYFKMKDTNNPIMLDRRWSMYKHGILMHAENSVADYVKPYFNRNYDGLRGYWYTPPKATDGHSAVAKSGNIYQICFKIFEAYYTSAMHAHKELIRMCIEDLYHEPLYTTEDLPSTARVTLTENEDYVLVHVKVTYPERRGRVDIIEEHQRYPAGAKVRVKGQFSHATLVRSGELAKIQQENGYSVITLPEINGYEIIALDKKTNKEQGVFA